MECATRFLIGAQVCQTGREDAEQFPRFVAGDQSGKISSKYHLGWDCSLATWICNLIYSRLSGELIKRAAHHFVAPAISCRLTAQSLPISEAVPMVSFGLHTSRTPSSQFQVGLRSLAIAVCGLHSTTNLPAASRTVQAQLQTGIERLAGAR